MLITWTQRLGAWLFIVFCIELGLFLMVMPWLDQWVDNGLTELIPSLGEIWDHTYFRCAVSGLGALNLFIGILELMNRLRPPSPLTPQTESSDRRD